MCGFPDHVCTISRSWETEAYCPFCLSDLIEQPCQPRGQTLPDFRLPRPPAPSRQSGGTARDHRGQPWASVPAERVGPCLWCSTPFADIMMAAPRTGSCFLDGGFDAEFDQEIKH